MALTATIYQFNVQLADVDRQVYSDFELRVARHPSETAEYMLARVLAYGLEFEEGIALTEGVSSGDEPALLVRDLTGRITKWIEIGAPEAERLHRGSKLAGRAAVYAHRGMAPLQALLAAKIHRGEEIPVYEFEREFFAAAAAKLERRNTLSLSRTEGQLYLDINGQSFSSAITEHRIG